MTQPEEPFNPAAYEGAAPADDTERLADPVPGDGDGRFLWEGYEIRHAEPLEFPQPPLIISGRGGLPNTTVLWRMHNTTTGETGTDPYTVTEQMHKVLCGLVEDLDDLPVFDAGVSSTYEDGGAAMLDIARRRVEEALGPGAPTQQELGEQ